MSSWATNPEALVREILNYQPRSLVGLAVLSAENYRNVVLISCLVIGHENVQVCDLMLSKVSKWLFDGYSQAC